MALIQWAHLQTHAIPDLTKLIYIPNDAKRTRAEAGIVKAMGLRKGVWDYFLACGREFSGGVRHGLWIEMKSPKDGLRDEQQRWGELMLEEGYATAVVRSWVGAREAILTYLGKAVVQGADLKWRH
jgi:hypothetical protein